MEIWFKDLSNKSTLPVPVGGDAITTGCFSSPLHSTAEGAVTRSFFFFAQFV
jgi:hypothetical protein